MKIIKKIVLSDGSEHDTKKRAESHMTSLICKQNVEHEILLIGTGVKLRQYLYDNTDKLKEYLKLYEELKEVEQLKNF